MNRVVRAELPSAVCTPESRRTPGTSPRIFQQQSAERQQPCWNFLQLLPCPPPPSLLILGAIGGTRLGVELVDDEVTEGGFEEVLLGTVFQQGVVHRGGSHLQAAKQKIHQRAARYMLHAGTPPHGALLVIPARRSRWPSGTAPAGRSRPRPSADTCWQN